MLATEDALPITASQAHPLDAGERPPTLHPQRIDSFNIVTFPARMFLALGWLRAGIEKLIDVDWWSGVELQRFLALQRPHALSFMHVFIDSLVAPFAVLVAAVVMFGEFAIAGAFVTGRRLRTAVYAGMTLNVVFVAMGVVTPSAFYLVLQLTLLAALGERRRATTSVRVRWIRAVVGLGVAASMLPLASTLHPAEVIDDPALMLATIAMLGASVDGLRIVQSAAGPATCPQTTS